jgi:hypothetical protein
MKAIAHASFNHIQLISLMNQHHPKNGICTLINVITTNPTSPIVFYLNICHLKVDLFVFIALNSI